MEQDYFMERIEELKESQLRQEFESFKGRLRSRQVDIERVPPKIRNLQERSAYCPILTIFQYKEIEPELAWVYHEIVYTNNAFLDDFEKFLREKIVPIPAKDFDKTPDGYLHFFRTPFDLIPVDIGKTTVSTSSVEGGEERGISHDRLKGVDFSSSCTLKMVNPETLYEKLGQAERTGNFTVVISKVRGGTETEVVAAFEYRYGNEFKTVDHFVFRRKMAVR